MATFLLVVVNPFEQFKKASDTQRKSDLAQIQRALEAYYQDHGQYPTSSSFKIVNNSTPVSWGSTWSPYINALPKDPSPTKNYAYVSLASGQSYELYASLDRANKDPQACKSDGSACDGAVSASATCGGICNYGVSSPNISP